MAASFARDGRAAQRLAEFSNRRRKRWSVANTIRIGRHIQAAEWVLLHALRQGAAELDDSNGEKAGAFVEVA